MAKKSGNLSVGFLFDDTLDSDDAVAQHVKILGAWLSARGHRVSYLVGETKMPSWAGGRIYSLSTNIKVSFNHNKLSVPLYSRKASLKRALADNHYDVLHVMTPYSPIMSQRVINLAPTETAVVGTFHIFPSGHLSRLGTRLLRAIYGHSLKRFGAMISVSQPAADFCRKSLGFTSIVIPNPVETSAFKVTPDRSMSSNQIVFLGRLVKRKGCAQLLKAFAELQREMPEIKLIIAGDGPQRKSLERLAASLGIEAKTSFLGHISEMEKPRLLAAADVACFPSLYGESFGIVLVEAMAAGSKTILGGDNPGYSSVLGEQKNCLINPLNTEAFARRLKLLLTDTALRRKLLNWQRRTVGQYDIDNIGPQVVSVYESEIARLVKKSNNKAHG